MTLFPPMSSNAVPLLGEAREDPFHLHADAENISHEATFTRGPVAIDLHLGHPEARSNVLSASTARPSRGALSRKLQPP